jgi:hypothetical protein
MNADQFINAVQQRLRGPAAASESVPAELRDHLADRIEFLQAAGKIRDAAEQLAVREMRPAWLLAWRLSTTHGWSPFAQALRALWLGGVAIEVLVIAGSFFALLDLVNSRFMYLQLGTVLHYYLWLLGGLLVSLPATFIICLALGRLSRGRLWAVLPCVVTGFFAYGFAASNKRILPLHVMGLLFIIAIAAAAYLGSHRLALRLRRFTFPALGVMAVWALLTLPTLMFIAKKYLSGDGYDPWPVEFITFAKGLIDNLWSKSPSPFFNLALIGLPWIFGLLSWLIEQAYRSYRPTFE